MVTIKELAEMICGYLKTLPEVKGCCISGSLVRGNYDKFSDIDIEIDVSGRDDGQFLIDIPRLLSKKFHVIFYDFAQGMAPEKYVVSVAVDEENPFMFADICCTARPHCESVTSEDLSRLNNQYDHILKLFTVNLKHYIRGADCCKDIQKMYKKLFGDSVSRDGREMLDKVYGWIVENAEDRHMKYIRSFKNYTLVQSHCSCHLYDHSS